MTAQPSNAALSSGRSSGILSTAFSGTTDRVFRERGHAGKVLDLAPAQREARGAVEEAPGHAYLRAGIAQRGPAIAAELADAARQPPQRDHVIAGLERRDPGADVGHDAGALVAEDGGQRGHQVSGHH